MGRKSGVRTWRSSRVGVFLVVLGLTMVGWMVPAIASAWLSWDGIDPVVALDGGRKHLSIQVEWPTKYTCSIQGPIDVGVSVPAGMEAKVTQESVGSFPCGATVSTTTSLSEHNDKNRSDMVGVTVNVTASESFPVKVLVSVDGGLVRALRGSSSTVIAGWVSVSGE